MNVNIQGRYVMIPGLNKRTPQYNVNLSEFEVRRLVNFHELRLSDATTGKLITRQNVNDFFIKEEEPAVVETPVKEIVTEEKPVVEPYAEPVIEIVEDTVEAIVEPEEPVVVETTPERMSFTFAMEEEPEEETTETEEEEVVSEKIGNVEDTTEEPKQYTKRNKKKRRNA